MADPFPGHLASPPERDRRIGSPRRTGPRRSRLPLFAALPAASLAALLAASLPALLVAAPRPPPDPPDLLPGARPLSGPDNLADRQLEGLERFLRREGEETRLRRLAAWRKAPRAAGEREAWLEQRRDRLERCLGLRDARRGVEPLELVARLGRPARIAQGPGYEVLAVRWSALRGVEAEGLLLRPIGRAPVADVIALGDADTPPEEICGLAPPPTEEGGSSAASSHPSGPTAFAAHLAASGCRVVVVLLVDRSTRYSTTRDGRRATGLSHREFLWRPAFELGRHILGYELQKVLALIDRLRPPGDSTVPLGIAGHGEGGLLALAAAALDRRIDAALVSGAFEPRDDEMWREPIERDIFGWNVELGDAELAALMAPRPLVVEAARAPELEVRPGTRAAPGRLRTPPLEAVRSEVARARATVEGLGLEPRIELVVSAEGRGPAGSAEALEAFLSALRPGATLSRSGELPRRLAPGPDPLRRMERQVRQIDADTQWLLERCAREREALWKEADPRQGARGWRERTRAPRQRLRTEVIGDFELPPLAPDPRARLLFEEPAYRGYEVLLDVFDDVIAHGRLLVPRGIREGERRPVVVCQHGLEGRPRDLADPRVDHPAYHRFGCRLAERGFVVFAPQNPYLGGDRFRSLQRRAHPLGKTLFSIIVPQHRQITRWLSSLPFVDPERIGFYGLSYGGKTAMRVPPLVDAYALSICSADFNDWIWKNASTLSPYTYVATGEYEIFEFDLASTFNYAELAALIAPRPFMVERGHRDGVAPDERVALEYAKVRRLYAELGVPERTEIEFFDGPHTIHGEGTFRFLHRWLHWPEGGKGE